MTMRNLLLLLGFILIVFQQFVNSINTEAQFIIFLSGIILIGVPHGAADLLVASRHADSNKKEFSNLRFFAVYLGRLCLFAAIIWFFPLIGSFLFILFSAYHFGETDLNQFKTDTFTGKLFVITYGLVILSVLLLHHFDEVKPFIHLFYSGNENKFLMAWIELNRFKTISASVILFFATSFVYFLKNKNTTVNEKGYFLIHFAFLLLILYSLPLLVGFTFYFVVWHSVLSLNSIIIYLLEDKQISQFIIVKQILIYSTLAISGIGIFGFTGFMFVNNIAFMGYVILGLAVLTAPHMQIMYDMYNNLRKNKARLPN